MNNTETRKVATHVCNLIERIRENVRDEFPSMCFRIDREYYVAVMYFKPYSCTLGKFHVKVLKDCQSLESICLEDSESVDFISRISELLTIALPERVEYGSSYMGSFRYSMSLEKPRVVINT